LFTNGVGRPDLHADAGSARQRATVLFGSLERLSALGRGIVVLPGHTTGPVAFDGRAVSARMGEVAAWLDEWLESASAFVERILSRLPAPPPNFARIARLNELGAFPAEGSLDLEAGPNRCAVS
jgi:glyoxylase-like metal-dependent hydrolase (beta-lactamase superfamily II)